MDIAVTEHLHSRMINLADDLAALAEGELDEATCQSIEIKCRELEMVTRRMKLRLAFARDLRLRPAALDLGVIKGGAA